MRHNYKLTGKWLCIADTDNQMEGKLQNRAVYHAQTLDWQPIQVPAHWQQAGFEGHQGVMWYRTSFFAPQRDHDKAYFLKFKGVDYFSESWLNGVYLGAHEGDFDAFEYVVSQYLKFDGENELIVKVEAYLDENPERKNTIKGGLYHWDCLPVKQQGLENCEEVPSAANAQYPSPVVNPGGIWQEVSLEQRHLHYIEEIRVTSYLKDAYTKASIYADVVLHNTSLDEKDFVLKVSLLPHNFIGEVLNDTPRTMVQRPGRMTHTSVLSIMEPQLWWSRELGKANLYKAVVEVWDHERLVDAREEVFGIREVKLDDKWGFYLNGKRLFLKGNNYVSDQYLSNMDSEKYEADVQLMLGANMNMTRLFAHAERKEFYRLCDENGLLIFQDLPFQWGYRSDGEFINRANNLARRFVSMLYNHPSIVLWCTHSESRYHDYNKLDSVLVQAVQDIDRTRPVHKNSVLVAEGGLPDYFATMDEFGRYIAPNLSVHWVGWYWGKIEDAEYYNPLFITEYGSQSLPDEASMRKFIGDESLWPADWETWRAKGFQTNIYNLMLGEFPQTLQELIDRTQDYQVAFYKEHTEALRRKKYNNVNGVLQFHFVNTWPAIDWSIIDYYRNPKKAYYAVAKAFEPLQLSFAGHAEIYETAGVQRVLIESWLVNDYHQMIEGKEIAYRLIAQDGTVVEERKVLVPLIAEDSAVCRDVLNIEVSARYGKLHVEGELKELDGTVITRNDKWIRTPLDRESVITALKANVGL
ncbi:glycoside hydrolase family 2 TIM barrel-domain containing protein [Aneurinibacillus sp. Ricciae_BoGa-3]|uniref:glycoside hydrolase family 2 protein n=1 Tax=Aneurinibacillus sp. Ricciae_BoGa-3 TaxID=3022697 RepID=UPI002340EA52|nr:glycoside hydrolase family 2 TIM barrel-domain containing protein [Aneurinibacillus sp. Ricciae_BoGa-3]WCK56009.1 glycoside hydrolase family 2 TIM barrel-domain containing protein [Aneurinibacillus sp. Ricciae_BoGa-3]